MGIKNIYTLMLALCFVFVACKTSDVNKPTVDSISNFRIKPQKLVKGDTVGLIAPGSYISKEQLNEAITNFKDLGYQVKYSAKILDQYGYLAGHDSVRVNEIHSMLLDKDIKAIVAVRGGYGCARLLPYLDYDIIRNNSKIIIGYSDITSLLYGIYKKTGLVCFHGPVGISTFNQFSVENFENILSGENKQYTLQNLPEDENQIKVIKPGIAKGELIGGNLSIVVSMIGTEYDIDSDGKIIFLEEIGEEPYRIDRMLTQMIQSGKFNNCAAVALGIFKNCDVDSTDPEFENSLTLEQVLEDRLGNLGVPVIYGLSFGHITNKFTLPFGINAELNTYNRTLTLLENSVQ